MSVEAVHTCEICGLRAPAGRMNLHPDDGVAVCADAGVCGARASAKGAVARSNLTSTTRSIND